MNVITAAFNGGSRFCTTRSVFQIDRGDILRFVGLDLPEYYEVHFSNSKNALAARVLASGDSVVIPWEYMKHGQREVFAWVYITPDAETGYTPYQVTIPLNLRSDVSDVEPTPAQEDIIGQAIAALNDGVERAEDAADDAEEATKHYPRIVDGYWQVWDAETQTWSDTGVKAVGEDGADGHDGAPGVTYTPTVSTDGEISWTNDGGLPNPQPRNIMGPQGKDGSDGAPGQDGFSPAVAISQITGGHSVSITDKTHPQGQTFNVMDGATGPAGQDGTTPAFSIGSVITGAAGSSADASITGTAAAPVLNLTIPQGLKGDAGNGDMIADDFSASMAYAAGDYVIYNGALYRFTAAHAAGAWVGTDATAVQLAEDVGDLNSTINTLQPTATASDVGKALIVKTVAGGKPTSYEYGEAGGSGDLSNCAPVITDTASGSVASFPDGAGGFPVKELVVNIKPVQSGSGDPSPTNVRPISGWTGCNISHSGADTSNPTVIPISWQIEAGTVYGGTLTINEDGSVELICNRVCDRITESNMPNSNYYREGTTYFSVIISHIYHGATAQVGGDDLQLLCDTFYNCRGDNWRNNYINSIWRLYNPESALGIRVANDLVGILDDDTSAARKAKFEEWLSTANVHASYLIRDPIIYRLESISQFYTFLGSNNFWHDANGVITITYRADTKLYIQKINTPSDDDMISDTRIESGKYFIVGGNLYKSTTTIPAGNTITPGTNCQQTNLAEALNALNA